MNNELSTRTAAIDVQNLSKSIKGSEILKSVNFSLPEGCVYGITGHNGAGKSMLLRTICGLVKPDSGDVYVFGEKVGKETEFPDQIGILIDGPGFLPHYSGTKNLRLLSQIRKKANRSEISEAIQAVGLDPSNTKPVHTYSTGMRQRLGLAQAIMEKPKLLLLDEPTSGVDREGIQDLHNLFNELNNAGITILIASHNAVELDELCDAAFVMENGVIAPL